MPRPRLSLFAPLAPAAAAALVLIAGWAAYRSSFAGAFILDDLSSVTFNPSIRQLWPLSAPPLGGVTGGRPLANFSFALNYAVGGSAVWGYHAGNLLVHLLAALALFGLVRRTLALPRLAPRCGTAALPLATAVALLWTVHPLGSAAVAYISQRTELLMALFYLLTLYCFVRGVTASARVWHPLAVVACACGMASKEVMATAPALVLLFDRTFVAGDFRSALRARWPLYLGLSATWLLLAWLVAGSALAQRGAGFDLGISPVVYGLTEARVILRYLALTLWPHPLVFDYGWDFAPHAAEVWPHLLAVTALGGATLWALRHRPILGFFPAAFLLILLPTSSLIPIGEQPMAESRVYLPLAVVLTLGVVAAYACFHRSTYLVTALLAAAGLSATHMRTLDYRDALTLWGDTVTKQPANARAHRTLADALLAADRTDEALAAYRTAIRLKPDYTQAHYNLGNALLARRDHTGAIASFTAALRLSPDHVKAHNNLANAFLALGRPAEALPHYETALRLQPAFAEARHNLGVARSDLGAVALAAGRTADAITHFRAAVSLAPDYAAGWQNLSQALLASGRPAEAITTAQTAASAQPASPGLHLTLGNLLFASGRLEDAETGYRTAIRLAPDHAEAHNNLGVLLLSTGRTAEARAHFTTALRLQPDYRDARANLALLGDEPAR